MKRNLRVPLTKKDIDGLSVGDVVFLSGLMFTARDEAHNRLAQMNVSSLSFDPSQMALYHCGPLMKNNNDSWEVISAGPTTSSRMDEVTSEIINRFDLHAVIGKGMIGENTKKALKDQGVFFVFTGGAGALAADLVEKVEDVIWLDELGMAEAVWVLSVNHFGPLIVAIDASGNSLFQ